MVVSQFDNNEFWQEKTIDVFSNSFEKIHENIDIIMSIVALNTKEISDFDSIYSLLLKYTTLKDNLNIIKNVFRYKIYDFNEYGYGSKQTCKRQLYLINKLKDKVANEELTNDLFFHILASCKMLLVHEFEGENYYDKYTHAFSWRRYKVIANKTIKLLRKESIDLLIQIYELRRGTTESNQILEFLLTILFYLAKPSKQRFQFDQRDDVVVVVEYLRSLLIQQTSVFERSSIIKQIKRFSRRELKEEYANLTQDLLSLAQNVETPREKLELLFYDDHLSLRKHIQKTLDGIIRDYYNWPHFFADLVDIKINLSKKDFSNFHDILNQLINNYKDQAKALLEYILVEKTNVICDYSSLVRANYKDEEYFYKTIETFWQLEMSCAKRSVLWMLTYGRNREAQYYQEADLVYFKLAVDQKLTEALSRISFTLPKYLLVDPQQTIQLISQILKITEKYEDKEDLIHALFEEKEIIIANKDIIKDFILGEITAIPLDSHNFDNVLFFLEDNFGFDYLVDYLDKRFQLLEKDVKYNRLPFNKHYRNPKNNSIENELNFLKGIERYLSSSIKDKGWRTAVVEFLTPNRFSSIEFAEGFKKLARDASNDKSRVIDLFTSLDLSSNECEFLIELTVEILNDLILKLDFKRSDLELIFGPKFIHNSGFKSGKAGIPFPKDIRRREQLNKYLENLSLHHELKYIFVEALKNVNSDIERKSERLVGEKW